MLSKGNVSPCAEPMLRRHCSVCACHPVQAGAQKHKSVGTVVPSCIWQAHSSPRPTIAGPSEPQTCLARARPSNRRGSLRSRARVNLSRNHIILGKCSQDPGHSCLGETATPYWQALRSSQQANYGDWLVSSTIRLVHHVPVGDSLRGWPRPAGKVDALLLPDLLSTAAASMRDVF